MFRNGAQATAGASEQASSTSIMWALQCCNTVEENLNKIGTVVGSSYWTLKSNDWKRTSTVQYAFQQLATQKLGVAPTEPRNMGTVQARYTTSPASCWWSEWLQCTVFETEIMMACVCVCVCCRQLRNRTMQLKVVRGEERIGAHGRRRAVAKWAGIFRSSSVQW